MKKYNRNLNEALNCVLALGDFDGVHTGHAALITSTLKLAKELSADAGVYTFNTNSKLVLGTKAMSLLTTESEKLDILETFGIDFVYEEDFADIRDFSPEQFCNYLLTEFNPKAVVCGENFTFGKNASADSKDLKALLGQRDVPVYITEDYKIDGVLISSSKIRNYISLGDMESANKFLGYPYFIKAKVVHGAELGRRLGFPTINQLEYDSKVVPKYGVYACECLIDDKTYYGVVNVGIKPTVSKITENPPVVFETHIIDYTGDLYGKTVCVRFFKMLREEKKFESLDALTEAVMQNIAQTREYFSK